MSRKTNMIVVGNDCKDCVYCTINGNHVLCSAKNKKYYYGSYVPCDLKKKEVSNG